MKKYNVRNSLYGILVIALFAACATAGRISLKNLVFLYEGESAFTMLPALVYHSDDSLSLVITEINLSDLQYSKINNTELKACNYRLSYRLLDDYESYMVIDSGSIVSGDTLNAGKKISILQSFQVHAAPGNKYLLELDLLDINRKENVRKYVTVDKSSPFTRQNFMVVSGNNFPLFESYLEPEEEVSIVYNEPGIEKLYVRCYFRDFPLARPPFVEERQDVFDYHADSVFSIDMENGKSGKLSLGRQGFYHFQVDTAVKDGLTLFRFYKGFPEIKSTSQLAEPLRYICAKSEFDMIISAPDQKEAIDQFWLNTAGNEARAKTLIQKYYSNVQVANEYFTSYQEGWKTDRGIIYIIFGKPDYVYRGVNQEEWIYGQPDYRNSLRFSYIRVINPFTDNDYMLLRNPSMKDPWYITVQSWRR